MVKPFKKYKIVLTIIIMGCTNPLLQAQSKVDSSLTKKKTRSVIFEGNHFGLNFGINGVAKATVSKNPIYNPTSQTGTGVLLGFNYCANFNTTISLTTGVGVGLSGRNFSYHISKNSFSPTLTNDITTSKFETYQSPINFLQIPLQIEKRWFKSKNYWFGDAGLNINFNINDAYETVVNYNNLNGSLTRIVSVKTDWLEQQRLCLNLAFGYGLGIITKSNNINKIGLRANISFNQMARSTYTFSIPNQPNFNGNYNLSGSYLGFYYTRLFTSANNRLRKIIQKS